MKRVLLVLPALPVVAALGLWTTPYAAAAPPATRVEVVKDVLHGVEVEDPYRWLEGDLSNPAARGGMTPEVAAWTDAQNQYTRQHLDALPGRAELEKALRPLLEVGSISSPIARGKRYFFARREGSQNQPIFYWREGSSGADQVLIDPAKLDPSGLTTIAWISPDESGERVAYGSYKAGDENTTLHLLEVASGKDLGLVIPNKVGAPDWLPDGSGFVYRNLADPKDPYSGRVRFHRMGQDPAGDPVLFRQFTVNENRKLATTYGPGASLSRDGRWLLMTYATSTDSNDAWLADFAEYLKSGALTRREVSVGQKGNVDGTVIGSTLYLQTTQGSPNGRVVAAPVDKPGRENWHDVLPERPQETLSGVSFGKGHLAAEYLRKATSQLEVFDLAGKALGELKLPGLGSAGLSAFEDRTEAYLSFTSYNFPSSIYRVDLAKPGAEPVLWGRPDVPVDPSLAEVEQVSYPSKDGTPISMFLVHRKGLERDGERPVLLSGYGGFNISQTPAFNGPLFQWLQAGGVYAVPNLRGGGEYGEAWHRAGMLEHKQNVFDDFIGAAQWLIAQRYTNPKRLAIAGGSNGGLLTGAALVQRPELFAAVIINVPLLDMLRYQDFLMARYWVPEYGSAEDEQQFQWLRAYSPYQQVRKGVKYPAVFLTAGENDARVHPLHARKMTARLQAATASDPEQAPVLLWVDREAGHGQGKPLALRLRDAVDQRLFLMHQLGMLPAAAAEAGPAKPAAPAGRGERNAPASKAAAGKAPVGEAGAAAGR